MQGLQAHSDSEREPFQDGGPKSRLPIVRPVWERLVLHSFFA